MKDEKNVESFCLRNGVDFGSLVTLEQVHSAKVAVVDAGDKGAKIPLADGLLTRQKGLPVAVFTADCLPVFISAGDKCAGVVHAGWKGLHAGVLKEAVRTVVEKFSASPGEITASIGPHIGKCCYRVGEDLKKKFGMQSGETHLDLAAVAKRQMKEEGVKKINVCGRCTCHEEELFFSYRRDKQPKRMISIIQM
ncbi:MAG: peptidoglycan editing factor PgeF [Endomicrobiales bacterium]|nr:peptidoglycan editing factor PgeF [Endomicrobiales bacterium]